MNSSKMHPTSGDIFEVVPIHLLETIYPEINLVSQFFRDYLGIEIIPVATASFILYMIVKFFKYIWSSVWSIAAS
jgi:hypothetical protein